MREQGAMYSHVAATQHSRQASGAHSVPLMVRRFLFLLLSLLTSLQYSMNSEP